MAIKELIVSIEDHPYENPFIIKWNEFWESDVNSEEVEHAKKILLEKHGIQDWGVKYKSSGREFRVVFTDDQSMLIWMLKWL